MRIRPLRLAAQRAGVPARRSAVVGSGLYPQVGPVAKRPVRQAAGSISAMERERALELLRGGAENVARWNRWRIRKVSLPDLSHSDLSNADLSKADLSGVDLHASNLRKAKLFGANLERADLHRSNLRSADLSRAVLRAANLRGSNLVGASLFGADLRRANLRRASFRSAEADQETRWPDGFDPGAHGVEPWPDD